jgi:5-methylcytosine-specific restriction endonuclease McrA
VPVGSDIVEMSHCDGQHLGCVMSHAANDSASEQGRDLDTGAHVGAEVYAGNDPARADVGASHRKTAADVSGDLCAENDSVHAYMGASVRVPADDRRSNAHAGANAAAARKSAPALARAKQTTPPALRRAVLARDQRRCRVPGCRNSVFLDVHHIELRSEGGRNQADNVIALCGAHHRAAHRGRLVIAGASASGVRFQHADGSPYGQAENPQALDARAKAFVGLRKLGFREGDVRTVLGKLRDEGELAAASTEQWLRAALERLTPRRARR